MWKALYAGVLATSLFVLGVGPSWGDGWVLWVFLALVEDLTTKGVVMYTLLSAYLSNNGCQRYQM